MNATYPEIWRYEQHRGGHPARAMAAMFPYAVLLRMGLVVHPPFPAGR